MQNRVIIALYLILFAMILASCSPAPTPPEPRINDCQTWEQNTQGVIECLMFNGAIVVQSQGEQSALHLEKTIITIDGTLHIQAQENVIVLSLIEGSGVISAGESSKVLVEGQQTTLDLETDTLSAAAPTLYDAQILVNAPLEELPRPLVAPTVIIEATAIVEATSEVIIETIAATATSCEVQEDWPATHTVQRGETLSRIANRYGVTLELLQQGNCLTNPDRIYPGQTLYLPPNADAPTHTPAATFTPSAVFLRADRTTLSTGECTTIRWDVDNVAEVLFEGQSVGEHDDIVVCPQENTTYTLVVTLPDETEKTYTITITIAPTPTP